MTTHLIKPISMRVPEDKIKQFLMVCLFGDKYKTSLNDEEKIGLAINRGYRDFCRTIRCGKEWNAKIELDIPKGDERKEYYAINNSRGRASKLIKEAIESNQFNDYYTWHSKLCDKLSNKKDGAIGYTYGQAQKWVNMTMKYLLILNYNPVEDIIDKLHIPLDSIIIKKATKKGIELITKDTLGRDFSWSRIKTYEHYWRIQKQLKENINGTPILWEFDSWNESTGMN